MWQDRIAGHLRKPHLIDQLRPRALVALLRVGAQRRPVDGLARQEEQGALEQQQAHIHNAQHFATYIPDNVGIDAER